jgi:hypothetical protein
MNNELKKMINECLKLRGQIIEVDNYNRPDKLKFGNEAIFIRSNNDINSYIEGNIRVWKTKICIGKSNVSDLPQDIQDIILTYILDVMKDIKEMMYKIKSYISGNLIHSDLLLDMDEEENFDTYDKINYNHSCKYGDERDD